MRNHRAVLALVLVQFVSVPLLWLANRSMADIHDVDMKALASVLILCTVTIVDTMIGLGFFVLTVYKKGQ